MSDTLKWRIRGELFEDGSRMSDWRKVEQSDWQWQYDTHELTFDIYEHDGDYWKLYRARWVPRRVLPSMCMTLAVRRVAWCSSNTRQQRGHHILTNSCRPVTSNGCGPTNTTSQSTGLSKRAYAANPHKPVTGEKDAKTSLPYNRSR